jgi:uncharacterized DUF497 family protein
VKYFDWDKSKNSKLRAKRKIGFEDVQQVIEGGNLLDTVSHPNKVRYPNQKMFVVKIDNYVYLVSFVEDEEKFFLKTIFPSRKATRKYLTKRGDK